MSTSGATLKSSFKPGTQKVLQELLERLSTRARQRLSPEEDLQQRLFRVLPWHAMFLEDLLSCSKIRFSDTVQSAAITAEVYPELLINPDFYKKFCLRDEWLLVVLLHELHHIRYGHNTLFGAPDLLKNIAFDAVINARIAHMFPEPRHLSLFRKLYPDPDYPHFLLTPPPQWTGDGYSWDIECPPLAGLYRKLEDQLGPVMARRGIALYKKLYDKKTATVNDIIEFLKQNGLCSSPMLLGSHQVLTPDYAQEEETDHDSPHLTIQDTQWETSQNPLLQKLTADMEEWVKEQFPSIAGRNQGVFDSEVPMQNPRLEALKVLKQLCVKLGVYQPVYCSRVMVNEAYTQRTLEPRFSTKDRTYWARRLLWNTQPLLCQHEQEVHGPRWRDPMACHVYLDVSGSMSSDLPWLVRIFADLVRMGRVRVFLFSNGVFPVTSENLRKGHIRTTWGTDLDCVLDHVIKMPATRRPRNMLVVTDGFFPTPENLKAFQDTGTGLHFALTYITNIEYAKSITKLPTFLR